MTLFIEGSNSHLKQVVVLEVRVSVTLKMGAMLIKVLFMTCNVAPSVIGHLL